MLPPLLLLPRRCAVRPGLRGRPGDKDAADPASWRRGRRPGRAGQGRAGQGRAPLRRRRCGGAGPEDAEPRSCCAETWRLLAAPCSKRRAASRERRAGERSPRRAAPARSLGSSWPPPSCPGAPLPAQPRAGTAPAVGLGALGRGGGAGAQHRGRPSRADSAAAPAPCPHCAPPAARGRPPAHPGRPRKAPRRLRRRHGRAVPHARHLRRLRGRGGSRLLPHLFPAAAAAGGVQERTVNKPNWYCSRGYSACRVKSVVGSIWKKVIDG